jgi:hypothetical protein
MRPKLAEVPDLIEAPLFVDHVAIAQHYGLRTGLLDLTESVNVAAFFATNELLRDGRWVPATDGWGVIYRLSVPRSRSPQEAEKDLEWMSPIGYQPFPRPNEQWAWAYELGITQDFWTLPMSRHLCFHILQMNPDVGMSDSRAALYCFLLTTLPMWRLMSIMQPNFHLILRTD